jgi:hypothetical protein
MFKFCLVYLNIFKITGADPGFQVRGGVLKKLRREARKFVRYFM